MFNDLRQRLEHLLAATRLGTLTEVVASSHYVVAMAAFTEEAVKALWVKIVFDLSAKGLVNGILDVPIAQINDQLAIIWVNGLPIICVRSDQISGLGMDGVASQRPSLPASICLVIGGPSGVGKTTLIERLQTSSIGHRVKCYIAYTTRPRRPHETNGVDYFFVEPIELNVYRRNPRFINFVEARGYWYWSDPAAFFESRWRDANLVHVFAVTQTHEFIERRKVIPDLLWVWLDTSEVDLRRRLEKRGDSDIGKSIAQNHRLMKQDRTGLVSLELAMETGGVDVSLGKLLEFIASVERKQT